MATQRPEILWRDFDEKSAFDDARNQTKAATSKNFVLEFNRDKARCAFNLDKNNIKTVFKQSPLQHKADTELPTRWINIWMPEAQTDVIEVIARRYKFSPRLKSSMQCHHLTRELVATRIPHHRGFRDVLHGVAKDSDASTIQSSTPESDYYEMTQTSNYKSSVPKVNHYSIVSEVWHFASIDYGSRFTCIGFNSLYGTSTKGMVETEFESNKPAGSRVWTWLIICDDRTVISIHENPFEKSVASEKDLVMIRQNLRNVFSHLSKQKVESHLLNGIMTVNIRPGLHDREDDEAQVAEESVPSLLFYYLFDDWLSSYALVAREEHQYGALLDRVRERMFESPNLDNAKQLHHYGRQLAVLKRIYASYCMIIDRLLLGPHGSAGRLVRVQTNSSVNTSESFLKERDSGYGVPLPTAAAVRFERLRDRINLYAMSEIQDCLDEKEALVMLNFNLVALKESSFVERLTRITILLAKVTILFLPVSLMSAYFAIPIVDYGDKYTVTMYWTSFAVIFFLSMIALVVFGRLSGTAEGKPIYKSLTRVGYEFSHSVFRKHRPKAESKA